MHLELKDEKTVHCAIVNRISILCFIGQRVDRHLTDTYSARQIDFQTWKNVTLLLSNLCD